MIASPGRWSSRKLTHYPSAGKLAIFPAGRPFLTDREALAHRPREPERPEVERVVARLAASHRNQELLGTGRERHDVSLDVAALLELGPVALVPALYRRTGPFEQQLLHAGHGDAVAGDLVREVGAEEEEHVALVLRYEDLVVADPVDRVREHPDELLAALGPDVGDVLRARGAGGREHAVRDGEATAHVEGFPGT